MSLPYIPYSISTLSILLHSLFHLYSFHPLTFLIPSLLFPSPYIQSIPLPTTFFIPSIARISSSHFPSSSSASNSLPFPPIRQFLRSLVTPDLFPTLSSLPLILLVIACSPSIPLVYSFLRSDSPSPGYIHIFFSSPLPPPSHFLLTHSLPWFITIESASSYVNIYQLGFASSHSCI